MTQHNNDWPYEHELEYVHPQHQYEITTMHDGGSEVHVWPGTDAAEVVESFTAWLDACASIPHIPWRLVEPADSDGRSIWTSPLPEVHGEFALAVRPV